MKILVTGSEGFIGKHLVKELRKNHVVWAVDRKTGDEISGRKWKDNTQWYEMDAVIHLAANSNIATGIPEIELYDTFMTTIDMLNFCKDNNVRDFIFASTSAIFGETCLPINEDSRVKPISHYGAAKAASETFICSYAKQYKIKSWILRFPNVVGSGATHGVILDLIKKHKANPTELNVLGNGLQTKPYIHVSELIEGIIYLWTNYKEYVNIFNIGPNGQTSVKEIAEMITNRRITYQGGQAWAGDVERYQYDTSKLKRSGWFPKMTSTEAVKLAIDEIKQEYGL